MEKIQRRALRFICDDFEPPLPDLLTEQCIFFLHMSISRTKLMAKEVSKTVHDISPFYVHDLINIKISNYNFWRGKQASLPQVNTTRYDLRSFLYETAQI